LPKLAKIDEAAAEQVALKAVPGTVHETELETSENGYLIYEIEIAGEDGKGHQVTVDAGNGKVLYQDLEEAADEPDGRGDTEAADDGSHATMPAPSATSETIVGLPSWAPPPRSLSARRNLTRSSSSLSDDSRRVLRRSASGKLRPEAADGQRAGNSTPSSHLPTWAGASSRPSPPLGPSLASL
jgi:Peptidase propeptide and YPEB domain